MGAACCQSNTDEKAEFKLEKNVEDVSLMKPDSTSKPVIMGTNEDKKLQEEVDEIWAKYDINKNGVLDQKEAYAFLDDMMNEVTGQHPTQQEIESNFKILDEDGSGDVSKEEA